MLFKMWKDVISNIIKDYKLDELLMDFIMSILLAIFTPFILVVDILLSPMYLIAYIVYKYKENKRKKEMLNRGFIYHREESGAYVIEYYKKRGKKHE